jgi:hypothetical protein
MSKTTDALKVVLDSIEGMEIDGEVKKAIVASVKSFNGVANSESAVAREDLSNDLKTANKTIKTLTKSNDDIKLELENSGGDVEQIVKEKQIEIDNLTKERDDGLDTISTYTAKDKKNGLLKIATAQLENTGLDMNKQNEDFIEGLFEGSEPGTYFAKDNLGNTIDLQAHTDNFLTKNKRWIKPAGSDTGMSGTNTNTQTTGDANSKKPEKIKDLIPDEFK